jgi:3-methyladenine DNA glycosylase AlkD
MDTGVRQFDTWEICDSFCSRVFARSRHAIPKALEWSARDPEFEKRAGFATMAHHVFADKQAEDAVFEQFFPSIVNGASDDRKYVKKAVSWALRQIGKRNSKLNKMAIDLAIEIGEQSNRSAQWVANDVLRELQNGKANILGYPRS